jgi:hypothetical protein
MEPIADTFDAAFSKTVDLANKMADKDKDADLWDIADGLLAGAIQYWLYSRQPCGDYALPGLHAHQHRRRAHVRTQAAHRAARLRERVLPHAHRFERRPRVGTFPPGRSVNRFRTICMPLDRRASAPDARSFARTLP